jgi:MYXO-CTERM domain-containing protein
MRKLLIALASAAVATQASAGNIFVDTFDGSNNPAFTTDYTQVTAQDGVSAYPAGVYAIGPNASLYHNLWVSYGDHTSGSGNYMIVNGYSDTSDIVWQSSAITLAEGTYTFSAWVANSCCNSDFSGTNAPPELSFSGIVGAPVDRTVDTAIAGQWIQLFTTFTVGAGGATGNLTLKNGQGNVSGNDFGVDDIVLATGDTPGSVPEVATWAMMLVGFGAIGAAARRHRTSLTFAQAKSKCREGRRSSDRRLFCMP